MQRSPAIQRVHDELQNVNKKYVTELIDSVNLTPKEKDIVIKTELEGVSTAELEDQYNLAFTTIIKTKKKAMLKIFKFLLLYFHNIYQLLPNESQFPLKHL